MKKQGFTLIELLATLVILGIISSIAVMSYSHYINHTKDESYETAEKSMKAAAESFLTYCNSANLNLPDECVIIPSAGESVSISLDTLVKNGFMESVKDQSINKLCQGNVTITNENEVGTTSINYNLNYRVCLQCNTYQSESCS